MQTNIFSVTVGESPQALAMPDTSAHVALDFSNTAAIVRSRRARCIKIYGLDLQTDQIRSDKPENYHGVYFQRNAFGMEQFENNKRYSFIAVLRELALIVYIPVNVRVVKTRLLCCSPLCDDYGIFIFQSAMEMSA